MAAHGPSVELSSPVERFGLRLAIGFGALALGLVVALLLGVWYSFYKLVESSEERLAASIAHAVGNSVIRVSFSGKHHAGLLIEEFLEQDPALSYVLIQTETDAEFASAGSFPATLLTEAVPTGAERGTLTEPYVRFFEHEGTPIREMRVPFREGYRDREVGVVRIGISRAGTEAVFTQGIWLLVGVGVLLSALAVVSVFVVSRRFAAPVDSLAREFQGILEHAPLIVAIHDAQGRVLRASRKYVDKFGTPEGLGEQHSIYDMFSAEERSSALAEDEHLSSGALPVLRGERRVRAGDAEIVLIYSKIPLRVAEQGTANHLCMLALDVTDQKALEECLHQARSMETIGQFAGGVAHDFNNILTGIGGSAQLIGESLDDREFVAESSQMIVDLCKRAGELTQRLLTFGRQQVMQRRHHDLGVLLPEMRLFLERILREDIRFSIDEPGTGELFVDIDRGQFEQVIMNLVANARDAIHRGGRIRISARTIELADNRAFGFAQLEPGSYVVVDVEDDGSGIPVEMRDRLFDPFATNKRVGQGTGLGLSLVHSIVSRHQGAVEFETEEGSGTTFSIWLPRSQQTEPAEQEAPQAAERRPIQAARILVAEDDDTLRGNVVAALTRQGHEVVAVADGQEAIALLRNGVDRFDLLLLDVIMPRGNGGEVFAIARAQDETIPVLFMTGYDDHVLDNILSEHRYLDFVPKPFLFEELMQKIAWLLETRSRPEPQTPR